MNETMRAALVIARRDFTALIHSRSFLFFLIGPIVMLCIAIAAGSVGNSMAHDTPVPVIAVAMPDEDMARLDAAHEQLRAVIDHLPSLEKVPAGAQPKAILHEGSATAVLAGTVHEPILHILGNAPGDLASQIRLLVQTAGQVPVTLDIRSEPVSSAPAPVDRHATAQLGQMALFLATMLLAGMVLSNLVEEKANKIIEILAASIPMEAIFLGKLFAMLAMALIAIAVWAGLGGVLALLAGSHMPDVPPPAIGWPLFVLLGLAYFSTAYLLLGSLYLGIGGMAATVRDVQTLSMPVSMGQVGTFLLANYATSRPGTAIEVAASLFPFSSPFVLMARAAQFPEIWPHLLLLLWQGLCTWLIIRAGTAMFRRNVLKSGSRSRRPLFGR